jgi:hypothetical protein
MSRNDDNDEPFLARWSRRKLEVQGGPAVQVPALDLPTTDDLSPDPPREAGDEPELDLSKLPKVEELTAESDFSVFLDKRVPQLLRNAALSRMWSLDPTIRDFIEVAENQWNWNVPGGAPFYEEMLGVPGEVGEAVAQAGSEAGRLLFGQNNVSGDASGPSLATGDLRLKDDPERGSVENISIATQYDQRTALNSVRLENDYDGSACELSGVPDPENAATQQEPRSPAGPGRRHGGALPS